ncbi:hypothetical protein RHSIM_Rhsim12G0033200 [Rhododendron simsii]|uniref:NB-ARC domain-containing protein n=1 Tax=Rhododendron simsii TaxID=118357 RepID=A0A834L8R1_RHOSS|nr:hypothetical protein RHSIM_Rhsim12G0033200 [Rhododendron simsii]
MRNLTAGEKSDPEKTEEREREDERGEVSLESMLASFSPGPGGNSVPHMRPAVAAASITPTWEVGKCLWVPIARSINYARKFTNNREALCKKASELRSKKDDIVAEIERFRLQRTPTQEYVNWRNEVTEMENKVATLEQEFNVEKKCVWGLCPNIFERIKLTGVERMPDPASKLTKSAYDTQDMVLDKLRDESSAKIGIWGMGGVGKTVVLQLLNNYYHDVKTFFDLVIWVTVSKSPNIRNLQNEVGMRLSIEINANESNDRVARKLFKRLEGKKYLLLLDDVWDEVDLSVVGFPDANQQNGCKVVLTTRKKEVCRKMKTDAFSFVKRRSMGDVFLWSGSRCNAFNHQDV